MSIDRQLYHAIAGLSGNPTLDSLMLAAAEYLLVLLPIVALVLWFHEGTEDARQTAVLMTVASVTSLALSYLAGLLYQHPSPYMLYDTVVHASGPENGFPSQHTAVTFGAVWPALRDAETRTYGGLLLAGAALTGFARIYVGEHFPMDVAGAIVVSLLAAGLVAVIDRETAVIGETQNLCERVQKEAERLFGR